MDKHDYKNMWVYIEHDGATVQSVSLELCCEARKLCNVTGEKLFAVVIGSLPESELAKVRGCGVDGFIMVDGTGCASYSTDVWSNVFTVLCKKYNPSAVFVGGTIDGRDFAPRFAARLNTGCTSDAIEVVYDPKTGDIEFIEPAVGGKMMAVITVPVLRPQVGTIRTGTFKYEPTGEKADLEVIHEQIDFPVENILTKLLSFAPVDEGGVSIADASVIVCVGNGLGDEEKLAKYKELADLLGGSLGCTRQILDRGLLPFRQMIGQSGTAVKPKLYICFGVSGAINHVVGFSAAEVKIAVNKDPNAAIFNYCDYGIVGDMDEVCDELLAQLKNK